MPELWAAADRVAVVTEHGASEQASDSPVAVLKGVDDKKVQDEQPGHEHRMVLARRDRVLVALDQVIDGERGARGRYWLEADGGRAVWRAVHDRVVLCLERPPGHRRVSEQQPMQVQDQASVQRAPVLPDQVILGVAIASQLLLAAVAQRSRAPVDDSLGTIGVGDDDALDGGRGSDALDAGPVGELGEQPGKKPPKRTY